MSFFAGYKSKVLINASVLRGREWSVAIHGDEFDTTYALAPNDLSAGYVQTQVANLCAEFHLVAYFCEEDNPFGTLNLIPDQLVSIQIFPNKDDFAHSFQAPSARVLSTNTTAAIRGAPVTIELTARSNGYFIVPTY